MTTQRNASFADIAREAQQWVEQETSNRIAKARELIDQLLRSMGLSIEVVYSKAPGQSAQGRGKPAAAETKHPPVKFRHPKDLSLSWTGRGSAPAWFINALASGMTQRALFAGKGDFDPVRAEVIKAATERMAAQAKAKAKAKPKSKVVAAKKAKSAATKAAPATKKTKVVASSKPTKAVAKKSPAKKAAARAKIAPASQAKVAKPKAKPAKVARKSSAPAKKTKPVAAAAGSKEAAA